MSRGSAYRFSGQHARAACRGDAGQVAGIEVIPFGILIFVVGSLLIANAWAVVDAKAAVVTAAREAARSYVEAPDEQTGSDLALAAFEDTFSGYGRNPDRATLTIDHEGGGPWARCQRVRATVRYRIPALSLPWIGGYGHHFDVRSTHSEVIDPFRAGLPAGGTC